MKYMGKMMCMGGLAALMAKVRLPATVKTKLTISNQKATRSERKLALQKSRIRCISLSRCVVYSKRPKP